MGTDDFPNIPAVGHFTAEGFEPEHWKSDYPNPAFQSRLPDDEYWGAKQVMAFTDDDIRAIVETGRFSDPRTVDYLTKTLAARRDKIGRAFFSKVLSLDRFRVENGELRFEDLGVNTGSERIEPYSVRGLVSTTIWTGKNSLWKHQQSCRLMRQRLQPEPTLRHSKVPKIPSQTVTVYVRNELGRIQGRGNRADLVTRLVPVRGSVPAASDLHS